MSYNNCQFTWLKQKETLVSLAESLLKDGEFFDCQLCAEGHHYNVHRVILSCNSPVFNNILQNHDSDLPVITLEGISSIELGALVEFMYTGVTRISPSYLKNFFQVAKSLQLAGLNHYDGAQIDKILIESSGSVIDTEFQYIYESYNQNILQYLDQSETTNESEGKILTSLNTSIFVDESIEPTDVVGDDNVIYEKYDNDFIKSENGTIIESLEPNSVDNDELPQSLNNQVDSSENEESTTETSLTFNKFHTAFVKNGNERVTDNVTTVYSISEDFDSKVNTDFDEPHEELEVTDEDKNFVYVKLDYDAFDKLKDGVSLKGKQNLSKTDVQVYKKKCLSVITPVEKNFVIKRAKPQNLVVKDNKASGDDKKIYICLKCGNKYSHRRTLLHHIHWICEQPATYSCTLCPYRGKRKFQLKSHMKHAHLLKMS